MENIVFISHRSVDKDVADMLLDFFSNTGIPKEAVFCSSLPGNDVNEKISKEIRDALKNSVINIVILSKDYYRSVYCLNEAGIIWYEDRPVIIIALPEIDSNNMIGFLNNEYKLRRLNCDTDVSHIYDTVVESMGLASARASIFTNESNKLRGRYEEYLKKRFLSPTIPLKSINSVISDITTDDERVVLYYILLKGIRKVCKKDIKKWLTEKEIHDVNIDNAFDLLASSNNGIINEDCLELDINAFRSYSANSSIVMSELKVYVDKHTKLAVDTFKKIWNLGQFDEIIKLFIAYIIDERVCLFGDRWMAEQSIKCIKQWEYNNIIGDNLSVNYRRCLGDFIQNNFIYAISWTDYGNPREYAMYPSLKEYLFNNSGDIYKELKKIKESYYMDISF